MAPRAQIIVSTHFDDAALSLAHVLQAAGSLATVVTVCGGPPPDGLPVSEWDAGCGFASGPEAAPARVAEDAAACAVTGARPLPLDHATRRTPCIGLGGGGGGGGKKNARRLHPLAPCLHRQPRPRARK